ncbi:DUF1648 domain-containing protein [Microbacterium dauci]|uniref:DUF1648 domain-containing protein n=1 Tax=Microbacterium dauci TaxID=3048008 RepID=A0ABT6ZB38_9MICO|nr:DUF1648 domain-containing protein [Microbacterium sp. LX3-4]MDJ1113380.1 DUF1648 domain-containing protein [Microbacterium sp. LX3-4]
MAVDLARVRSRFTLVALILPAIVVAIAVLAQVLVLPNVPAVVATHWAFDGTPDGFSPAWTVPVFTAVLGLGLPAVLFGVSFRSLRRGEHGAAYRLLGAVALGTATLLATLMTWTLLVQTSGEQTLPVLAVIAPIVLAVALGAVGWMLQPHAPWHPVATHAPDALPLGAGERVLWTQAVTVATSGRIVLGAAVVLTAAVAVMVGVMTAELWVTVIAAAAALFLAFAVVANSRFHVRVDAAGLTVVSSIGWPRVVVPLAEITSAEVVNVSPMAEFGGWGLRWGPGGNFGVVLRAGEGIRVRRANGRFLTVTVDDAATAAALLTALAARRAPG